MPFRRCRGILQSFSVRGGDWVIWDFVQSLERPECPWILMDLTETKKDAEASFFNDLQTSKEPCKSIFGAGNESCTRALSLCFPINFSAVVSSEGLNSSLVFFPRQQSSSTNFHQRPRTAIPFSRHGRRTRRYQRPTTAAPLAQPGLLASEMATASRVETALGWMPCGPQLKVARGEGHAASEERWGRMFTSPGRLTTESERRTTASN